MPSGHGYEPGCKCKYCKNGPTENRQRSERRSDRRFPRSNGTRGGRPAYVQRDGDRTVAYSGPDNVEKIVSNDGENADYMRDADGTVTLDSNDTTDAYSPEPWKRH